MSDEQIGETAGAPGGSRSIRVGWWRHRVAGTPSAEPAEQAEMLTEVVRAVILDQAAAGRLGLYLAASGLGIAATLGFMGEYRTHGPAFANPRLFPWILASGTGAWAAAALGLPGPNVTLVGGREAAIAALAHASDDLAEGRVDSAVLVGCEVPVDDRRWPAGGLVAVRLAERMPDDLGLAEAGPWAWLSGVPGLPPPPAGARAHTACELLSVACRAVEAGNPLVLGSPEEGWFALAPAGRGQKGSTPGD